MSAIRTFATGATRDVDTEKLNYEGFLSPLVLERFARYMHRHRRQPDGQLRAADNWQKGITRDAYMESGLRHVLDVWMHHRGLPHLAREPLEESLCAALFNLNGYLFETLKVAGRGGYAGMRARMPLPLAADVAAVRVRTIGGRADDAAETRVRVRVEALRGRGRHAD